MRISKKTRLATKQVKAGKVSKIKGAKASKAKASAVVSAQWKHAKEAGLDRSLGHGGIYNLRKGDVSANIVSEGRATGALSRQVAIFSGTRGLCFIDGNANKAKQFVVAGHTIDLGKVKNVLYFGNLDGAIRFVRSKGKAAVGATKKGERFTHYYGNGEHYGIATDGKRLLRLEAFACSGNAANYVWTLGK